jgi:hypothetical protein
MDNLVFKVKIERDLPNGSGTRTAYMTIEAWDEFDALNQVQDKMGDLANGTIKMYEVDPVTNEPDDEPCIIMPATMRIQPSEKPKTSHASEPPKALPAPKSSVHSPEFGAGWGITVPAPAPIVSLKDKELQHGISK